MKKIMFFLYTLAGGGAERTVVNIINNLDRELFDPLLVLGSNKCMEYFECLNKDIRVIFLDKSKLRYCLFSLRKCIITENPSLIFTTLNGNNLLMGFAKLLSLQNVPLVVREANHRSMTGKVKWINKIMTYVVYNFVAEKVVTLSVGVKNDLQCNFYINKNKIVVIYNPIENNKIIELSNDSICETVLNDNKKTIIAIGRLVEQKNYNMLIKAIAEIKDRNDIQVIILGKGPLKEKMEKLCVELGVENNIKFLGFKNNPYKYLSKSDVFVLTSNWEGFGHVIVEAMACGTPVIATNCKSGPDEILLDNKYGILVGVEDYMSLADEISDILYKSEKREFYIRQGHERAKRFDALIIVKEYDRLFTSILNKKGYFDE